MRALLITLIVYCSIPVTIFRPMVGLVVYSWLAYMRPHDLAWMKWTTRGLSFYAGAALLVGVAFAVVRGRERLGAFRTPTFLMVAFLGAVALSSQFSVQAVENYWAWGLRNLWKAVLIAVITTGLVRSRERYRALVLVMATSLGLLGLKFGLYAMTRGGVRFDWGPGGFMADNNTFAVALNMALPLLVAVATTEERRLVKWMAIGLSVFSALTVVFTFSRGGILTLGVVGALLIKRARRPGLAIATAALAFVALLATSSEGIRAEYLDRVKTVAEFDRDASVQDRFTAWKTAWRVFEDYPILGVGPDKLEAVHMRYSDEPSEFLVAHNTVLQLLAECGLVGFGLWLALMVTTLLRLRRLEMSGRNSWIGVHAGGLRIALLGYLCGGLFLSMPFFDLVYHLIALGVSLEVIQSASESEVVKSTKAVEGVPWWRQVPA